MYVYVVIKDMDVEGVYPQRRPTSVPAMRLVFGHASIRPVSCKIGTF